MPSHQVVPTTPLVSSSPTANTYGVAADGLRHVITCEWPSRPSVTWRPSRWRNGRLPSCVPPARQPGNPSTLVQLTPTELRIAQLVSQGMSNKDVAELCWISPRTVAFHLRNVFTKTGVTSRGQLAHLDVS
jgi:DNA-binding CsgD family transcriptional regulator